MSSLSSLDKEALRTELLKRLEKDLEVVTLAQKASQAGATHEENKSEGDKDMRATEVSYVARGQAARVQSLIEELGKLQSLVLRSFQAETPVALGALVCLKDEKSQLSRHFLLPCAGGIELKTSLGTLHVTTSSSPLGQVLLGAYQGDLVVLETGDQEREYELLELA